EQHVSAAYQHYAAADWQAADRDFRMAISSGPEYVLPIDRTTYFASLAQLDMTQTKEGALRARWAYKTAANFLQTGDLVNGFHWLQVAEGAGDWNTLSPA